MPYRNSKLTHLLRYGVGPRHRCRVVDPTQRHSVAAQLVIDNQLDLVMRVGDRDSLGGSARTAMIVHCKPTVAHYRQTLVSLTYAARAKLIRNSVRCNVDDKTETELEVRGACVRAL